MSPGASNVTTNLANTAVATTETVVGNTISQSFNDAGAQGIRIRGVVGLQAAAGTTAFVVRVRQGNNTIVGPLVQGVTYTVNVAASAAANIPFDVVDTSPQTTQLYTVTVQATGAAGTIYALTAGVEVCDQYEAGTF